MSLKPKVIIDTDAGLDDAVAILMILQAHKKGLVEVVAITTVYGNTSLSNVNVNIFRILEVTQLLEIPVYSGASRGLVKTFVRKQDPFHGHDGFGDVLQHLPSSFSLQKEPASVALKHLVEESAGEIILIAIGPLTNVALAMNLSPDWCSKLRDFYVMGGNIFGKGNISLSAEFNFFCDPEAAKVVLSRCCIPIKLTPWETCVETVNISYEERMTLGTTGTPRADLLNLIEAPLIRARAFEHWINCDQVSAAWLLEDYAKDVIGHRDGSVTEEGGLVTKTDKFFADVEIVGEMTRGQMIVDWRNLLKKPNNIICLRLVNKNVYTKYLELAFM